ncbi:MAG: hypothetical protein Q4B36_05440 [Tissierellia bacterium]|nr:hypothetical protein [Tissierellia bacterium]
MYKENYGNIPNRDKINFILNDGYEKSKDLNLLIRSFRIGRFLGNLSKDLSLDKEILESLSLYKLDELYNDSIINIYQKLREEAYFFNAKVLLIFDESDFMKEYKENHILNDYEKVILDVDRFFDYKGDIIDNDYKRNFSLLLSKDIETYLPKVNKNKFPYNK